MKAILAVVDPVVGAGFTLPSKDVMTWLDTSE